MVRGLSSRKIAAELGISPAMAKIDMNFVRDEWRAAYENSRDEWSGRLLATYEWLLAEVAEAWETHSKLGRITRVINPDGSELVRVEPPDPRWLSGMLAVTKEVSTFLGLREGVDTVSRIEVPESTRQALAPMAPEAYLNMIAGGGMTALNTAPIHRHQAAQMPRDEDVVEVVITDDEA